jgi:hypothetical protein
MCQRIRMRWRELHPDHLLLDSAPNFGPLISRWKITKFENCWYKSVRIFEVLNVLFQQFLNLSSSQQDMSGPMLGTCPIIGDRGVLSLPGIFFFCSFSYWEWLQQTCREVWSWPRRRRHWGTVSTGLPSRWASVPLFPQSGPVLKCVDETKITRDLLFWNHDVATLPKTLTLGAFVS